MLALLSGELVAIVMPAYLLTGIALAAYLEDGRTAVRVAVVTAGYYVWLVITGALADRLNIPAGYWCWELPVGSIPALLLWLDGRRKQDRRMLQTGIFGVAATMLGTFGLWIFCSTVLRETAGPATLAAFCPQFAAFVWLTLLLFAMPVLVLTTLGTALFCGRFLISAAIFILYPIWLALLGWLFWAHSLDTANWWPIAFCILLLPASIPHALIGFAGHRAHDRKQLATGICGTAATLLGSIGIGLICWSARFH